MVARCSGAAPNQSRIRILALRRSCFTTPVSANRRPSRTVVMSPSGDSGAPGVSEDSSSRSGNGLFYVGISAVVLLGIGFQTILIAFVADLFSANRKILEDIRYRQSGAVRHSDKLENE